MFWEEVTGPQIGFQRYCNSSIRKRKINFKDPESIRPWQHVLEPLSGYLLLGQLLFQNRKEFAEPWNFGPSYNSNITVRELVNIVKKRWNDIEVEFEKPKIYDLNILC